ncbi:MAG: hypothetical protein AB4042_20315 [Leptolyngbyaceae cyanobacterium]
MNRDADVAQEFLAWLLQNPTSDQPLEPSGDLTGDTTSAHESTGVHTSEVLNPTDHTMNPAHRHDETQNAMLTNFSQPHWPSSVQPNVEDALLFELGDMSAVQDRFYAVLKRRLRAEIQQNPPLFPWESEILAYETDSVPATVVPVAAWMKQIQDRLPVPMSEQTLATLFSQCQTMVHRSLQQGAKLVQTVESLFPGEDEMLTYLARLVLAPSFRDGGDRLPTDGFPVHYDVATPVQQMALSLITVSEIFDALTLKVSQQQPRAVQQWPTGDSSIDISVVYKSQATTPHLRVEGRLPGAGHLVLSGSAGEARSHRSEAGCTCVELFDTQPGQVYQLTIQLNDDAQSPLVLAVQVVD